MSKKQYPITLLEMLLKGYPIRKDNLTYWLSEDKYLCQEATKENTATGKKEKVLLKVELGDYSLHHFILWADTFTLEERVFNGSTAVLNDLKRGD